MSSLLFISDEVYFTRSGAFVDFLPDSLRFFI